MLATVTNTAQNLVAATTGLTGSFPNKKGIQLRAPSSNTGTIHIGRANTVTAGAATTAGLSIEPGNAVKVDPWFVGDASLLFVIASAGSQQLFWDLIEN